MYLLDCLESDFVFPANVVRCIFNQQNSLKTPSYSVACSVNCYTTGPRFASGFGNVYSTFPPFGADKISTKCIWGIEPQSSLVRVTTCLGHMPYDIPEQWSRKRNWAAQAVFLHRF